MYSSSGDDRPSRSSSSGDDRRMECDVSESMGH